MAGVTAGRLNIEIIAEVARLQADMDKVKRAVKDASNDIARSAKSANDNLGRFSQTGTAVTKSVGAQRAAMQQLSYQIGDVAQGFALGVRPMTIFAQQGGQVIQALSLMGGGSSRLLAVLGNPWVMGIAVAATAMIPLISKLFETRDAAQEAIDKIRELSAERAKAARQNPELALSQVQSQIISIENRIQRQGRGTDPNSRFNTGKGLFEPDLQKRLQDLKWKAVELRGEIDRLAAAEQKAKKASDDVAKSTDTHTASVRAATPAINEEQKALEKLVSEYESAADKADSYLSNLQEQIDTFGLTADELLKYNSALEEAEALQNAMAAPTQELRDRFLQLADAIPKATDKLIAKRAAQRNDDYEENVIRPLKEELQLVGLVGEARERAAIQFEAEALKAKLLKDGVADVDAKVQEYIDLRNEILDKQSVFEREAEAARELEHQLGKTLSILSDFGGSGLNSFLSKLDQTDFGHNFLLGAQSTLDNLFGGAGAFSESLGAFGVAVEANKLIGSLVGFEGGPLGIFTGLFSSTPRGKATFSGGLDYGLSGNSASRRETAGGLADQLLTTLGQLADALGADLGGFTGTIGVRDGNLRYDPSGQGITKTSKGALDFGQDAQALLTAAIKDAISDGVFTGLEEGFQEYLQNGAGDIEQRVQDLLDVTGIRKVVEAFKDPLGAALKEFDAQAQQYRDLYEKVGVSAQETADLENYLADTRQALIDQYSTASEDDRRVRELEIEIMQLQGREQEALNAQRELEKEGVSEAVAALLDHRNALLDEAAAAQQAAAVQQEAQSLQIRLQQALGNSEEVLRLQREAELAAVDPLNRALLQSVYAAEDAARAQQQLAQAQQAAAQSAQSAASALASGGAGAVTDPLIGGAVSALINGTTTLTAAAEQIKATFQTQATAAFPNDAAAATNFYNSLINGLSASTAANQRASGPPVGGVDVLNYQPGNTGAPGNGGFDNHAGRGNRQFATPLDAMKAALLDAGGRQLWAQWLMGGAGSGDLPGWGGFSEGIRGMQRLLRDYGAGFVGSKALDGGGGRRLSDEGKAALSQAYEREKSEIEGVIDEFSSLRDSLMEYRDSLELVGKTQADTYAILRRRFLETAGLARSGDKEALGELQGAGQAFLGAAARNAQTTVGFRKEVAFVQSYLDQAIGAANEAVDYQEESLRALEKSVDGLIDVKEAVLTVAEILKGIRGDNSDYRREQQAENIAVAKKTGETAKTLDRVSQNGTSLRVDLTV